MPNTFPKRTLRIRYPGDSEMSYWIRNQPEGASQVFIGSAPIVITGGYVVAAQAAVDTPVATLFGFALRDGRNGTAGQYQAEIVVAFPGLEFYANMLSADGTGDRALLITDIGTVYDIEKNAVGDAGQDIWHVAAASVQSVAKMVSFDLDYHLPNVVQNTYAEVGDLNPRCSFNVPVAKNDYIT
jgi:hypothetical protein